METENVKEMERIKEYKKQIRVREWQKKAIVERFLKKCKISLEDLKENLSRMVVDYKGKLDYTVLVRVFNKEYWVSIEYYQSGKGIDRYNDNERFWYEFPVCSYLDSACEDFNKEFVAFINQFYDWIMRVQ